MGKQWAKGNFCTMFPDRWFGISLSYPCYLHDLDYMNKVPRKEADKRLRQNISNLGLPILAWVMYIGVRLGGWIYYEN